jgi:hypothetical protein
MYVYAGANGDRCIYVGDMKERHIYIKMCVVPGPYNRSYFAMFVFSCISLNGSLHLLWEPCFDHNKII